jgi:hypothetical protein
MEVAALNKEEVSLKNARRKKRARGRRFSVERLTGWVFGKGLGFFLSQRLVHGLLIALGRAGRAPRIARLFLGRTGLRAAPAAAAALPARLVIASVFVGHISALLLLLRFEDKYKALGTD